MVSPAQEDMQLKIQPKNVKILGTYIGVDNIMARDETWTGVLNKIEVILNWWRMRDLKLNGKVVVLNSLILSKLNYVLGVLDLPLWALNRITEIITKFIWGSTVSKIARKTLISKYKEGGLRLLDVDSKKKAFRIKLVRKYLYDDTEYGWKSLMSFFLNKVLNIGDYVLLMKLRTPMTAGLPLFL